MRRKNVDKADYGNWLSNRKLLSTGGCLLLSAAVLVLLLLCSAGRIWVCLLSASTLAIAIVFTYRYLHHRELSYDGGGLMGSFHRYVLDHLAWDGRGRFLDIGCGGGALVILTAKRFPEAECIGMDNWDPKWEFSQDMCEQNAALEGVDGRCRFVTGDARRIDFPDTSFDAVVSNLVYIHVDQPDKAGLVKETLRVLRPGGCFALLDHFCQESVYGDIQNLVGHLRAEGISDIHFIPHVEKEIPIPSWMLLSGKLANLGILYGRK